MPWNQDYTSSDEKTLSDTELHWPDCNRSCISITDDLSGARGTDGVRAKVVPTPEVPFAAHEGLDQFRTVLRRRGLKAISAAPAVIADASPLGCER
jgi:hypothetical protein